MPITFTPFDYANADESDYQALNHFRNKIRKEQEPDDPPIPLEEMITAFQTVPDSVTVRIWVVRDSSGAIIGQAVMQMPLSDNLNLAQFSIAVLPEHRQCGIGRELLRHIVHTAEDSGRNLLISSSRERIPAGDRFLERIGASKGLEGHTNQLTLTEIDWNLITDWQDRAVERAKGFELGWWAGPYPDEDLKPILALHDLFNQQPLGELEVEEFKFTEEMIRQQEKTIFARGYERWTVYVREKATGDFAGYSEVLWSPNRPDVVLQGITGVFPAFRNKGLGRWMKAALIARLLTERPEAKFIRTENADSNAPMLKINRELGFKPYIRETLWQVQRETVEKYLEIGRGMS